MPLTIAPIAGLLEISPAKPDGGGGGDAFAPLMAGLLGQAAPSADGTPLPPPGEPLPDSGSVPVVAVTGGSGPAEAAADPQAATQPVQPRFAPPGSAASEAPPAATPIPDLTAAPTRVRAESQPSSSPFRPDYSGKGSIECYLDAPASASKPGDTLVEFQPNGDPERPFRDVSVTIVLPPEARFEDGVWPAPTAGEPDRLNRTIAPPRPAALQRLASGVARQLATVRVSRSVDSAVQSPAFDDSERTADADAPAPSATASLPTFAPPAAAEPLAAGPPRSQPVVASVVPAPGRAADSAAGSSDAQAVATSAHALPPKVPSYPVAPSAVTREIAASLGRRGKSENGTIASGIPIARPASTIADASRQSPVGPGVLLVDTPPVAPPARLATLPAQQIAVAPLAATSTPAPAEAAVPPGAVSTLTAAAPGTKRPTLRHPGPVDAALGVAQDKLQPGSRFLSPPAVVVPQPTLSSSATAAPQPQPLSQPAAPQANGALTQGQGDEGAVAPTAPLSPAPFEPMRSAPEQTRAVEAEAPITTPRPATAQPSAPATPAILPAAQAFGAALQKAWAAERKPVAAAPEASAVTGAPAPRAQPVDQPAPALDIADRRWPHAMAERIERVLDAANEGSTRVRLHPDALGPVDVAVRRDGEVVHVHFTAAQAETRQLLVDAQPRLQDAADARGLKLGRTDVSGGALSGGESSNDRQRREAPQPHSPSRPAPARATARAAEPDDTRIA